MVVFLFWFFFMHDFTKPLFDVRLWYFCSKTYFCAHAVASGVSYLDQCVEELLTVLKKQKVMDCIVYWFINKRQIMGPIFLVICFHRGALVIQITSSLSKKEEFGSFFLIRLWLKALWSFRLYRLVLTWYFSFPTCTWRSCFFLWSAAVFLSGTELSDFINVRRNFVVLKLFCWSFLFQFLMGNFFCWF